MWARSLCSALADDETLPTTQRCAYIVFDHPQRRFAQMHWNRGRILEFPPAPTQSELGLRARARFAFVAMYAVFARSGKSPPKESSLIIPFVLAKYRLGPEQCEMPLMILSLGGGMQGCAPPPL
jgi:hypothetical protein